MKINVEPKDKCKAVICLEKNCPWNKVCANNYTAGDFRSEDGVTPRISLRNGEVYCETIHSKGDGFEYHECPIDHHSCGLLCWDDLIEEINNFQI
jgi:hypothetical protein